MSASRDKSSKFTFLYTDLYSIYLKSKNKPSQSGDTKERLRPVNLAASIRPRSNHPIQSLEKNLKNLERLHDRLKYMLEELEELSKPKK